MLPRSLETHTQANDEINLKRSSRNFNVLGNEGREGLERISARARNSSGRARRPRAPQGLTFETESNRWNLTPGFRQKNHTSLRRPAAPPSMTRRFVVALNSLRMQFSLRGNIERENDKERSSLFRIDERDSTLNHLHREEKQHLLCIASSIMCRQQSGIQNFIRKVNPLIIFSNKIIKSSKNMRLKSYFCLI